MSLYDGTELSFVEIGVLRGATCKRLLQHCGEFIGQYWAIDPWQRAGSGMEKRGGWSQHTWDEKHLGVCMLMQRYPQLKVLRTTSLEAAKVMKKMKFDAAFIDANHTYPMVRVDIKAWKPLIKKGGLLTGHDYAPGKRYTGVQEAVNELLHPVEIFRPQKIWVHRC
jgi:hypothetical protein